MLQCGETIVTTWRDNGQKKLFQNTFLQNISFTKLFIAQHISLHQTKLVDTTNWTFWGESATILYNKWWRVASALVAKKTEIFSSTLIFLAAAPGLSLFTHFLPFLPKFASCFSGSHHLHSILSSYVKQANMFPFSGNPDTRFLDECFIVGLVSSRIVL